MSVSKALKYSPGAGSPGFTATPWFKSQFCPWLAASPWAISLTPVFLHLKTGHNNSYTSQVPEGAERESNESTQPSAQAGKSQPSSITVVNNKTVPDLKQV